MLDIIFKGFIIGFLVAAPLGPAGLLCVQRTLNKDRMHGFVTGLGVMTSDFVYACITIVGLRFATNIIENNKIEFQFVGSIILVIIGISIFKTNPLKGWNPNLKVEETHYIKDFLSAFVLTISNVSVIFIYITLYARFGFHPMMEGGKTLLVVLSLISILAGTFFWTFILTYYIDKVKNIFSRNGLLVINRITGTIIVIVAIIGIITSFKF